MERAINRDYYADPPSRIPQGLNTSMVGTAATDNEPFEPFNRTNPVHASLDNVAARPVSVQNRCRANCRTNKDCHLNSADDRCMCSVQSEQYQPGAGTVAFVAACILSLSGKREETKPCPCNGTYVSRTCCRAWDGLVWEAKEFKLGELIDEL